MTRAWLLFVAIAVTVGCLLSCAHTWIWGTGLSPWISIVSLLSGAIVSGFLSSRHLRRWIAIFWLRSSSADKIFFLILFAVGTFCFLTLSGDVAGIWQTSNPDNLGDLPFHRHLVEFFARGAAFPPANPIFSGEPLRYAFGMDFWDALWVRLGLNFDTCIILTGIMSLLVTLIALWRAGGLLLMAAFFFSGGLVWTLHWEGTFGPTAPLVWKNLFHAVYVTQRGFWWAIPAGVEIIRKWTLYLDQKDEKLSPAFLFIWCIFPLFHLHTFVILSLWMGLSALLYRRIPWRLVKLAPIPAVFVLHSISTGNVQASLAWQNGWMLHGMTDVFRNFGVWLALPAWTCWRWIRQRRWKELGLALVLTVFALNVQLAPWAWDQIKIILWVYLLWTFWAWREFRWQGAAALGVSLILFWPGLFQWISGWPSLTGHFQIQDTVERATLEKLLEGLNPDDTVAAYVDYRTPLYGSGQSLAMGYAGAVQSHGLPLRTRQNQLNELMSGGPEWAKDAQEMGVKWIVWNDNNGLRLTEAWAAGGWKEEKIEGAWHLWGKSR